MTTHSTHHELGPVLDTRVAPSSGARIVEAQKPDLLLTEDHSLCPGCGEPLAVRVFLEAITELGLRQQAIAVAGIGCYTAFSRQHRRRPGAGAPRRARRRSRPA